MQLNEQQQQVADAIQSFLLTPDETEIIINGGAGTGKSFLISYLVNKVFPFYLQTNKVLGISNKYNYLYLTATTNSAAENLASIVKTDTCTIHTLLGLVVINDYSTGKSKLSRKRGHTSIIENSVIIIDEAGTSDSDLSKAIHQYTNNCKIIYVGHDLQCGPIYEKLSQIYNKGLRQLQLTKPVRNASEQALIDLCKQVEGSTHSVLYAPSGASLYDLSYQKIHVNNKSILHLTQEEEIVDSFQNYFVNNKEESAVIACYTNDKSNLYNTFIHELLGYHKEYEEGIYMTSCGMYSNESNTIRTEQVCEIKEVIQENKWISLPKGEDILVHQLLIRPQNYSKDIKVYVPVDRVLFNNIKKHYAKLNYWVDYYALTERYIDLRHTYSQTVHKTQGRSVDTVFVDINDISSCKSYATYIRLLYVAISRAKKRIIFLNNFRSKKGEFVYGTQISKT